MNNATILIGDVRTRLQEIEDQTIQTCVTSPPYWGLRDYGHNGQLGLEQTPHQYIEEMVQVFREVRRTLKDDGTLWLNIGDSYATVSGGMEQLRKLAADTPNYGAIKYSDGYAGVKQSGKKTAQKLSGLKHKDLVGIPWRLAFALQDDGWYLRQDIIWHKPNPMPESVTDRCTKAHEYVFLLTKNDRYFFDNEAIAEPAKWSEDKRAGEGRLTYSGKRQGAEGTGQEALVSIKETRNRRSVWSINTKPFRGAHFAVMPEALAEPCILAGSNSNDLILDPFTGAGTTAVVALRNNRNFIGTELNPEYAQIAHDRINKDQPLFNTTTIK